MIVSNAFIIDNKLVIIDGKEINVIDDEVETIELDVTDNKLNGFKAGKLVYYNNNYYVYNIKGVASFAIFNTSGLADKLYTNNLENDAYLNTLNIYDHKLFKTSAARSRTYKSPVSICKNFETPIAFTSGHRTISRAHSSHSQSVAPCGTAINVNGTSLS